MQIHLQQSHVMLVLKNIRVFQYYHKPHKILLWLDINTAKWFLVIYNVPKTTKRVYRW
jgi:hypothetical protein